MTNKNFLENNSLILEELNWIEKFFINKYSFITYPKKDNRKETLITKDIFFIIKKFKRTLNNFLKKENQR